MPELPSTSATAPAVVRKNAPLAADVLAALVAANPLAIGDIDNPTKFTGTLFLSSVGCVSQNGKGNHGVVYGGFENDSSPNRLQIMLDRNTLFFKVMPKPGSTTGETIRVSVPPTEEGTMPDGAQPRFTKGTRYINPTLCRYAIPDPDNAGKFKSIAPDGSDTPQGHRVYHVVMILDADSAIGASPVMGNAAALLDKAA